MVGATLVVAQSGQAQGLPLQGEGEGGARISTNPVAQ